MVCLKKAKRFDVDVVFEYQVVLGFGLSCALRCVGEGDTAPKGVALLYKTEYKTKVLIRSLFTAEEITLTRIINQGCNGISEGPYVLS